MKVALFQVFLDSELLVKQLNGEYRVKHPNMKPLYARAKDLLTVFDDVRVTHVLRAENKAADALVNEALDLGQTVGDAVSPGSDCDQGTLF